MLSCIICGSECILKFSLKGLLFSATLLCFLLGDDLHDAICFNHFFWSLHSQESFYSHLPAENISRNEPSPVFSCCLGCVFVFFWLWGVLSNQTLEISNPEWVSVVREDQRVVSDLDLDPALPKLVGDVFGILNELPKPSYSAVLVFRKVIEVLGQLLGKRNEPRSFLRVHVLIVCQFFVIWALALHQKKDMSNQKQETNLYCLLSFYKRKILNNDKTAFVSAACNSNCLGH